ncbi:Putative sodium-coupled neutral amino acid transporter 11 [Seminavis robusta]|uniref:Sodium-coupled neutral amino acid transporter 11 n=1 Tax=Seminavis robusta TaxID=568900 RepID=A0A9N8DJT3_9STRA|nr:Putative sodium-coupled neutral amino acid transporter 11 [Seminavis robusta]|eukprot:Sro182_g079440.1 Putative sodium-coupled neutral amino acid transporter 11 (526) ;mRNA; r:71580-73368
MVATESDAVTPSAEDGVSNNNDLVEENGNVSPDPTDGPLRQGTISSARYNVLCTMVGGGCLSLPMAFQKTGNGLFGPCMLLLTAAVTDWCFRMIIAATRKLSPVQAHTVVVGKESYESMASAAFGARGFLFTKWLVTAICIFGAVGYAVLLRDLLQPISDAIFPHHELDGGVGGGPSLGNNLTMMAVILLVTPLCGLQNLSSLEKLGAASMSAIIIVGGCIAYRSLQCLVDHHEETTWPAFQLWPDSAKDVLDAFPLFVSCYVCHYNIPLVHNELQSPTPQRVSYWLRSTTISASLFYMAVGLAGSAYGKCTDSGKVQGNILLDFDEDDPLLVVARMCLACTVTLAFPLLVIPARDIMLRTWFATPGPTSEAAGGPSSVPAETPPANEDMAAALEEPLLPNGEGEAENPEAMQPQSPEEPQAEQHSLALRLGVGIAVLWSAAGIASSVKSIDIVWDLLGSSLSVILSYLLPSFAYIAIFGSSLTNGGNEGGDRTTALSFARGMIYVFVPLMVISTINAFYNTLFR